ncbi:hypothetical protein FIBSPDRAFT_911211 [Athelia psychrophila]|uniref:DNA helicase n=1 Tax=Athelia psychrophila TaxID=1759441 RepID=A0A166IJB5_9AGAM|nr:hypothetical protein FIBSPDRAFT_911211 [Fibularhizoctonia sp. CBS 109695]
MMDAHPKPKGRGRNKAGDNTTHHRKSEKEDDEQMKKGADESEALYAFEDSLTFIKGAMRTYQIQGFNWMVALHHNGLNGILSDKMGLGKTLQTISFLSYLKCRQQVDGPHLVLVPKSTLYNWAREFAQWTPDVSICLLTGSKEERAEIIANWLIPQDFNVCIAGYETCLIEKSAFKKFSFKYIIINEVHHIKNVDSILSQIVHAFMSRGRLLITGTPLQNGLKELICGLGQLLHKDDDEGEDEEEQSRKVVKALHKILRPFLLRRVKAEVGKCLPRKKEINIYVGLTEMQHKWYRSVLEKDIDAEPGPPYTTDKHIAQNSGKTVILGKLLKTMEEKGSRVLIFSPMSRIPDILAAFLSTFLLPLFVTCTQLGLLISSAHVVLVTGTAGIIGDRKNRTLRN